MLQNVTTIAAWLIAGPETAAKTHKITTQIKKARNRKKDRARPAMNYDCIMIGFFPI